MGSEMCIRDRYALLAEHRAGDAVELPKELVQDVESEPGSYQEARQSKHAKIWDGAMSAEVEGFKSRNVHVSSKDPSRL